MKRITNSMQEVAAEILLELEVLGFETPVCEESIAEIIKKYIKKYDLCSDPFTGFVCTQKEYSKNSLEYDKQIMLERYGHCDGLE